MTEVMLVTGATSNVGRALVGRLRFSGRAIRAAARDPEGAARSLGVQAAELDWSRQETWDRALTDVSHVFVCPAPADVDADKRLNPFVDRMRASGVRHIVLLTMQGADHADRAALHKVEQHVIASGVPYTILRPTWFMQNFNPGFLRPMIVERNSLQLPAGDGETAFIDARDIAHVAAECMLGDSHHGRAYTLTGPQPLSYDDVADIISKVSGRIVQYVSVSDEAYRDSMVKAGWPEAAADYMTFLWSDVRNGSTAQVSPDFEQVTGQPPISFRTFAEENAYGWK